MFFLQVTTHSDVSLVLFLGTLGMLVLVIGLILFIIFHQRSVIRYQQNCRTLRIEQQKMMLTASIKLQEEERQRLAADLHDDAGPYWLREALFKREPCQPG
jgi:signal transduction histidine kinase